MPRRLKQYTFGVVEVTTHAIIEVDAFDLEEGRKLANETFKAGDYEGAEDADGDWDLDPSPTIFENGKYRIATN